MMVASACGRIKIFVLLLLLVPTAFLLSQGKKSKEVPQKGQPTFRVPVDVVVVNAAVTDKQGNPVIDLTQSDFKLYEDGKQQPIQTFALESYAPIESEERAGAEAEGVRPRVTTPGPNSTRPRLISILIDDITTSASRDDYPLFLRAMTKFVEQDLRPGDQVAILSASGRVQFPFSDSRQRLLEEIDALFAKLNFDPVTKSECPTLGEIQAKKIAERLYVDDLEDMYFRVAVAETIQCMSLDPQDSSSVEIAKGIARVAAGRQYQESEYRSRILLNTFRQYIRTLKHFDATKSAVIFSEGFLAQGDSLLSYALQDLVDQALSSGVVLNAIDVRGLYTPVFPASERQVLSAATASDKQTMYLESMTAQEDPLFRMSNDTGGLFYHNSNDLYDGLKKIVHRQSSYYVLTYTRPSQKYDGRYHQIKLEVARQGLELSYRKGYYAPKEELTFERKKKEDIVEALQAPGNLNEIPIRLAYNYYQEDDSTYVVSLSTNVSIRGLHFLDEDSRRKNLINLVVVAFDEADHFIDGIEKSIDFKLSEPNYDVLLSHGLNSKVEFKLPLGRYKIKAVVREGAQGKMGSVTKAIEIP
jgi:VWFA-related protein